MTATATRPTLKQLRAEHATAQAAAADAIASERKAEAAWKKFFALTREDGVLSEGETATPFARAEAILGVDGAKTALLGAQLAVAKANARAQSIGTAVRDAEDEAIETELRATCPKLLRAAEALQPDADRIAELLQQHSRLRAGGLQITGLQSSTVTWESPLSSIARAWREAQLISS